MDRPLRRPMAASSSRVRELEQRLQTIRPLERPGYLGTPASAFGRRPGYGIPHHRQHGGPGLPLRRGSAPQKGGQAAQALGRSNCPGSSPSSRRRGSYGKTLLKGNMPPVHQSRRQGGKAARRQGGKAARRQGGKAARRQGGKAARAMIPTQPHAARAWLLRSACRRCRVRVGRVLRACSLSLHNVSNKSLQNPSHLGRKIPNHLGQVS